MSTDQAEAVSTNIWPTHGHIQTQSCTMPAGGQRFSDMEMLVGMEDEQVDTARSRAGSCVEFYTVKVSFLLFWELRGSRSLTFLLLVTMWNRRNVYKVAEYIFILCGRSENLREFHRSFHSSTPECASPLVACLSGKITKLGMKHHQALTHRNEIVEVVEK